MVTKSERERTGAVARYLKTLQAGDQGEGPADVRSACLRAGLITQNANQLLAVTDAGRAWLMRFDHQTSGDSSIGDFRAQHLQLSRTTIMKDGEPNEVLVNDSESPLAWLARRKARNGRSMVDPTQFAAGERLRIDFTRAHMMPRVTSNWSAPTGRTNAGGAGEITDLIVAARQRVSQALDTVGPEFSGILLDVCCFLHGLEQVERDRGWPVRSGKIVLQLALDRLARHYGLATDIRGREYGRLRNWSDNKPVPAA